MLLSRSSTSIHDLVVPGAPTYLDECRAPEVAVERDGLFLTGGVTGSRCECAADLLAVEGYRESGIDIGIDILTDLEDQTVGAGAESDRCRIDWGSAVLDRLGVSAAAPAA